MGTLRVGLVEAHPTTNNKIRLNWSEPANAADAGTTGNYSISGGPTVSAAVVVAGSNNGQVDLTLAGLTNGTTYIVTVINVRAIAGGVAIISPNEQQRFIWREVGDNNLNGVVETGGTIARANRNFIGDQLLGYNVLGNKDITAPIITNVTPASAANILKTQVVSFDVTDSESPFRRIIVKMFYDDGTWDLVHDGDNFGPKFQGPSNTRTGISHGFHLTILMDGGWKIGNNPHLTPYAIDTGGNENL